MHVRQKIKEFSHAQRNGQPGLGYYNSQLLRQKEAQVMSTLEVRRTGVQHSWKQEGFSSSEVATLICQAADPMTPTVVRVCCLWLLQSCFEKKGEVVPREPQPKQTKFYELCAIPNCPIALTQAFQTAKE